VMTIFKVLSKYRYAHILLVFPEECNDYQEALSVRRSNRPLPA
jgi:hypothetical protein